MTVKRGQKFFPGLSGLQAKINEVAEPVTDRGLTGPAARDAEDVQERLRKRAEKLARRAKQTTPITTSLAYEGTQADVNAVNKGEDFT